MAISDDENDGSMDPEDEAALRGIAFSQAADQATTSAPQPKREEGSGSEPEVQQLLAVLGSGVSAEVARKLLR